MQWMVKPSLGALMISAFTADIFHALHGLYMNVPLSIANHISARNLMSY